MKSDVAPSRKPTLIRSGLALLITFAALQGPITLADEVRMPVAENVRQSQQKDLPRRGQTQSRVESRFGEPQQRTGAVGEPPISQWHYADFVVYFENSHVVHAVAKRGKNQ